MNQQKASVESSWKPLYRGAQHSRVIEPMAHVTFIHGILNKPSQNELLNIWNGALAAGEWGIDLGANGVSSSMVYWAEVLYAAPDQAAGHESADAMPDSRATDVPFSWLAGASPLEREIVNRIAAKLDQKMAASIGDVAPSPSTAVAVTTGIVLERIPLPWDIKRKVMESLLRDVHHYLFNSTSEPRPGEQYKVQDEIRKRFLADLAANRPATGPHIVVSHSMGTVIAYDCLKRVPGCSAVDALVTLGSPLGIDEIRDLLQPGWTPDTPPVAGWSPVDAFPSEKVRGAWPNLFDWLDPVDATAPHLAALYMKQGQPVIQDVSVSNSGWWRHDLTKYFSQPALRQQLAGLLQI
jgi:hypothetical protein